jgi:hypothetical protein
MRNSRGKLEISSRRTRSLKLTERTSLKRGFKDLLMKMSNSGKVSPCLMGAKD